MHKIHAVSNFETIIRNLKIPGGNEYTNYYRYISWQTQISIY